jgi:hypothetical protein
MVSPNEQDRNSEAANVTPRFSVMSSEQAVIDAVRKAVAEAEVILRQAHDDFGFRERPGPKERAWQRGEIGKSPAPDPPGYFLNEVEIRSAHAVVTMLGIARATRRSGTRKAAYWNTGVCLRQLRQRRSRIEWIDIVKRECGLSKTSAYRIMAFARKNSVGKSMGNFWKDQ